MVHPMNSLTCETPMVERIARALTKPGQDWPQHVETARAVLLAMKGPTTAMLEAARPGIPFFDDLADDWDAMLTQAARPQGAEAWMDTRRRA
jgi:hypothetical protein